NTRSSAGSGARPRFQLAELFQKLLLPAPVQLIVAGTTRSSRGSNVSRRCAVCGRRTDLRFWKSRATQRPQMFAFMVCSFREVYAAREGEEKQYKPSHSGQ